MNRPPARLVPLLCAVVVAGACADLPNPLAPDGELLARGGERGRPGGPDAGADVEEFAAWDPGRWEKGDHPLGLGYLSPDNVGVEAGQLMITLPGGTQDGGEIKSVERFRSGLFEARIRAASAPGSLTAFFLYEYSDRQIDEVDIEIIPDHEGDGPHVMFTTWVRDVETNHALVPLEFDPTAAFHTYGIETSRKAIRFYLDGELWMTFTDRIPSARMHLMVNAWWPWWLFGEPQAGDAVAAVDWIRY